MTASESTETHTLSDLRDRELEHHIATLGLRSIEDYVQWCAGHGFSRRIDKHWHQRCNERYIALQQDLKSRSTRKKRELRHPQEVILQIARGQITPSDLTQPHFAAISAAFAFLEPASQDAFLRLLLHVEEHADLLRTEPVISQLGKQPGNTFIDGLSALARQHGSWLRSVEVWKAQTHNSRRQFSSLARHLLAKYPIPTFMDSVWFMGSMPGASRQQQWFIQIGNGRSPAIWTFPFCLPVAWPITFCKLLRIARFVSLVAVPKCLALAEMSIWPRQCSGHGWPTTSATRNSGLLCFAG